MTAFCIQYRQYTFPQERIIVNNEETKTPYDVVSSTVYAPRWLRDGLARLSAKRKREGVPVSINGLWIESAMAHLALRAPKESVS